MIPTLVMMEKSVMKKKPDQPKESKKRMGRPPMGPTAKNVVLSIRVSRAEIELWTKLAAREGLTLRQFIMRPVRSLTEMKGKRP
jgi:hypothetical protein